MPRTFLPSTSSVLYLLQHQVDEGMCDVHCHMSLMVIMALCCWEKMVVVVGCVEVVFI